MHKKPKTALALLELCKHYGQSITKTDLAMELYPEYVESIEYETYKCPKCKGTRKFKKGTFNIGVLGTKQCKLPKSKGKKCGAYQKKYKYISIENIREFKDYVIKNRCETNLKKNIMDVLVQKIKLVEEIISADGIIMYRLKKDTMAGNYYRFKKISSILYQANLHKEYLETRYFQKNLDTYFSSLIASIVGIKDSIKIKSNKKLCNFLKKIMSLSPLSFEVLVTEDRPHIIITRGKKNKNEYKKLLEFFLKCFISDTILRTHREFRTDLIKTTNTDNEIEKIYKKYISLKLKTL